MKISMNKKYRTRDGRDVEILKVDAGLKGDLDIIAIVNGDIYTYYSDGKYGLGGELPLDLIEVSPYEDFEIDEPVMVSDFDCLFWNKRYFAGINDRGKPMAWSNGKTSWLSNGEKRTWSYCRRPTEEESK